MFKQAQYHMQLYATMPNSALQPPQSSNRHRATAHLTLYFLASYPRRASAQNYHSRPAEQGMPPTITSEADARPFGDTPYSA